MMNTLIIVSAIVVILLLWIIVGLRHLRYLAKGISGQWEVLDESLRKRQDLVPNLIETVRTYDQGHEDLIAQLINVRMKASKEYSVGAKKVEYEHDLSRLINEVLALGKELELRHDTNFLELRREIDNLEKNILLLAKKYNEMVRYYNQHRKMWVLLPVAAIFRYEVENIFEVEV